MIFGITGGSICAGRSSFSDYLVQKYGFVKIDFFTEFTQSVEIEEVKYEEGEEYTNKGIESFKHFYSEDQREKLLEFINGILNKCRADWK